MQQEYDVRNAKIGFGIIWYIVSLYGTMVLKIV